jgi:xylulokinase
MAKDKYLFVIDIGTSSLKAAIMGRELNIIKHTRKSYSYRVLENMGVEIDPEKIWAAVAKAAADLGSYRNRIEAITLCTFCPALTPMDTHGNALRNSIIHLDRRTYPQARKILRQVGEKKLLEITGNLPFPGGISLTSLLWIKENEPDVYRKTIVFGHMNTFIMKRLVGKWVIDPTNASMTGLYETCKYGNWSRELTDEFNIDISKLPTVRDCDSFLGGLSEEAANMLGLRTGTPVIMGGGDTACAAFGAGSDEQGEILNIVGSSELLTITLKKPFPGKKYNLRTHVTRNRWVVFVITVSGIALEWFRKQFCRDMNKKSFYSEYLPDVLQQGDSTEAYLPHICGDRYSMQQRKGAFSGLTLNTSREDMLRAMVTGVMTPLTDAISECSKRVELSESVFLTGGGANHAIKEYKERTVFAGYKFDIRKNCSLIGAAKLAAKYVN